MNSDSFKHFAGLLLLSVVIILFANIWAQLLSTAYHWYLWSDAQLASVFSSGSTGTIIRRSLTITLFPLLLVGIPAGIYYAIKHKLMPYFYHAVWFFWIILITIALIRY